MSFFYNFYSSCGFCANSAQFTLFALFKCTVHVVSYIPLAMYCHLQNLLHLAQPTAIDDDILFPPIPIYVHPTLTPRLVFSLPLSVPATYLSTSNVYLSMTGLFHLAQCPQGSSILQRFQNWSVYSFVHWWMLGAATLWLLSPMLLCTWPRFPFLWKYTQMWNC